MSTRHALTLACVVVAATAFAMTGCGSGPSPTEPGDARSTPSYDRPSGELDGPLADAPGDGFSFTVADGAADDAPRVIRAAVAASLLPEAQAAALLARLPSIDAEPDDAKDFALRPASRPPPRTGDTVEGAFPPPVSPDDAAPSVPEGPTKILRYQPEGDVPIAPRVSVTFDRPMVPLTSHDTLAAEEVPARITPEFEGTWRWVGTKTLFFDPDGRAPMATEYTVEVPAGVEDAAGNPLAEGAKWTFATPPPRLLGVAPSGHSVDTDPTFVLRFDQRIDPEVLLESVRVEAGDAPVQIRALSDAERAELPLAKDEDADGRWVAFKARAPLPTATSVTVIVPEGTPSAEGPRVTDRDQRESFKTYGPFEIHDDRCGWGECRPSTPWAITMTNPIDEEVFDPEMVRVDPPVDGLRAEVHGQRLALIGMTRGRTTYTVTLSDALTDTFGQTLTGEDTVEFEVGEAPKVMGSSLDSLVVLDPSASRQRVSAYTVNYEEIDVALYRVTPSDYPAYLEFLNQRGRRDAETEPPGERVSKARQPTQGASDELTEVPIDLGPGLTDGRGHVIVMATPVGADSEHRQRDQTVLAWVQATAIGLDAFVDAGELIGWATDLGDGSAMGDVALSIEPQGIAATTGADGLATIPLPSGPGDRQMLVAQRGEDVAFLPDTQHRWGSSGQWYTRPQNDHLRWMVFDDRKLYRPSETVSVKGIVRVHEGGERGDVAALPAGFLTKLGYKVVDSRNNDLAEGDVEVSARGTFHLTVDLPDTPNLGHARIVFSSGARRFEQADYTHTFQIQEFRRPEFEVTSSASEGPHLVGGEATVSVEASYFAGGPLPGADVGWSLTSSEGRFTPPNQEGFEFGRWVPWWRSQSGGELRTSLHHEGMTDASGEHTVALSFAKADPPLPVTIEAEATVTDVNRQAWTASQRLLVHPGRLYVGLRSEKRFVGKGEDIVVDAVVADIDGERVAQRPLALTMARLEWRRHKGDWVQIEADPETCELTSGEDPETCRFTPKAGGTHKIRAVVRDRRERPNMSEITVWVSGGKRPPSQKLEREEVELIPERRDWAVGETATILVQAPFWPAEGVMHIQRDGIVETRHFEMDGPTHTLEIPVEEWMIPNFHVLVSLNGAAPRVDADGETLADVPKRPAFALGQIGLRVPPALRTLDVAVEPAADRLAPGDETSVTVRVRDEAGQPVADTEVTVIAVDEAVLAMTGYRIPDPIDVFYSSRGSGTQTRHLREHVIVASLADVLAQASDAMDDAAAEREESMARGGDGAFPPRQARAMKGAMPAEDEGAPGDGGADGPIAVRKDFDPLAAFAPTATTDGSGRARVPFKLPDNLTRYRIMVVAAAKDSHFGAGEAAVTARLPLMVRMSPPRFLNFGDRFELPVVLQNQTDEAMRVDVAVRATNAEITEGAGRRVEVPANDRVEVRFSAAAAKPGTARFQAGASSGSAADAAEVSLPVWTPATTEAFATYGQIDDGAHVQPVRAPEDVVTAFGGLDVQIASTQLQALTDAVIYLTNYRFECAEQIASRVVSIAALRDVLDAFDAPGMPEAETLIAAIARDMDRLRGMQNDDGGWGFWRRGEVSWPFLSAHVTHALARAKLKGFEVPERLLSNARRYLRNIESHIERFESARNWKLSPAVKRALRAYALYTLNWLDERDTAKAERIISEAGGVTKTGLETLAWIYPVLSGQSGYEERIAEIRRHLNNQVRETAGAAHFSTSYSDGAHVLLHSSRRVDGILLEGLIIDQPEHDLIPKIVRGLLGHRTKGRWANTQESAWVLLGLDRYFQVFEKVTPDFTARVWLGDQFAGQHAFKGRTTETHKVEVPMAWLAEREGDQPLVVDKRGAGRLYYRLGMTYAPASLKLDPADHGFYVERTYLPIDHEDDVTRDDEGRWVVKAGARVRVKLTMVAPDRRYHVALVDPMPAGFEAVNPELRGAQSAPPDDGASPGGGRSGRAYHRWWGPWYEHQNLRDERAEAFSALLWDGVYNYTYIARATTPGVFVAPPAKAEEMYHPETFGRSASDTVIVEAP